MTILAVCPVHGSFPSRFFGGMGHIVGLTLAGNVEPCPQCNSQSRVMEGTFNIRDGMIEILAAPGWTRDIIREASEAVRTTQARIRSAASEDLAAEIAALSERLAAINAPLAELVAESTRGKSKKTVLAVLGAIISLLMWLYSPDDVGRFTHDVVAPVVDQALADNDVAP